MDDDELRRRFAQGREAERGHAPHFAQVLGRSRVHRRARERIRVRPLAFGAAAVAIVATAWLAVFPTASTSPMPPGIADWRAPSDVFLRTPNPELLGAMPALGASVLDTMMPPPYMKGA
jgi:hypothetical protein